MRIILKDMKNFIKMIVSERLIIIIINNSIIPSSRGTTPTNRKRSTTEYWPRTTTKFND
jgi:hypothetical protein